MIRKSIRYVVKNASKKPTLQDYIQIPDIGIKKSKIYGSKYVARPIFNSIKVGKNIKKSNILSGYQIYKIRHSKRRTKNIVKPKGVTGE